MKIIKLTSLLGAAGLAASLVACGGGGGGDTTTGAGQSTFGVITGFGSVYVNGIEYETNGTSIRVGDDSNKSEDDLRVGMMACVQGSHNGTTGTATSISAHNEVEGMVTSNSIAPGATTGQIGVMGYIVNVDGRTIFESKVAGVNSVDQIAVGNIVEVSGYSDGVDQVFATRIEVYAANLTDYLNSNPEGVEIKGVVQELGTADPNNNESFKIGSLVVDYRNAIVDNSLSLVDGAFVEVKSTQDLDANGFLIASKVEDEDSCESGEHHDDDEYEMRGKITMDFDGNKFMIDRTEVIVDGRTELEDLTTADLVAGTYVEVEGYFDQTTGQLLADKVEAEDEGDVELKSTINSIDKADGETNVGTIILANGWTVHVSNDTMMFDSRSSNNIVKFNLTYLQQGHLVEVYGVQIGPNEVNATKIELED